MTVPGATLRPTTMIKEITMREKFKWKVKLAAIEGGQGNKEVEVQTYWDPNAEDAEHQVGMAAAIQEWFKSGKTVKFAALEATRV